MAGKISLSTLAAVIHPYPTRAEAFRKLGDQYNGTRLPPRTGSLLKQLLALRRSSNKSELIAGPDKPPPIGLNQNP